ncbi:MAG: ferrous iron transporter B [Candidatus Omnitrophota bacterium]
MFENKENKFSKKILLMGNPNVGKSAVFSRLTGARVTISNYPGTTIGFSQGYIKLANNETGILLDVPGVYHLDPLCKTDKIAVDMLKKGNILINVLDATNLERNLFLTLELRERKIPMIIALNMWDETRHKGIEIDVKKLEQEINMPVVPICAITGFGIKDLVERIKDVKVLRIKPLDKDQKWEEIGRILETAQTLHHHHHTLLEIFEDISTRPITGMPFALVVVYAAFKIIRFIGEGLINYLFDPFFNQSWLPLMEKLSVFLGSEGIIHDLLVGRLVQGAINFGTSFGLLTTALYIPIAAVLPYILSFYLVLGLLEDFGYLPRLATQADVLMHRLGLHGYAIIPMIIGLGCNVPGAMALRLLESRREKFIAATLMAVAVPCMAQVAMIVGLVGQRGGQYLTVIFGTLALILIIKGLLLNAIMPGKSPEILWEIPPYRLPQPGAVIKKLWMRVSEFLKEAVPFVLLGVFIVNILYLLGIFDFMARMFSPVLTKLWGLPRDTVAALFVGFLRKDVAVGMLAPLALSTKQLIIACTILAVYFPCMATFAVMVRELGIKDMAKSACIMLLTALVTGIALNLIL